MWSETIVWEGPFSLDYVIDELHREDDFGLVPDLWNSYYP